ncbi:MAG: carboxypeptidase-like regulatory domain-containing protein [Thermostichales cyanobacterium BF4_bins_65]
MMRTLLPSLLLWGLGMPVWAHGVELGFSTTPAIEVQARYDTGQPMAKAQVTVFAPGDPGVAWLTGQTDGEGRFWFRPDPAQLGAWQVRVRQGGHGGMLTIPVTTPAEDVMGDEPEAPDLKIPASPPASLSPWLRLGMAASWVWGLVGTALFFARKTHAPS